MAFAGQARLEETAGVGDQGGIGGAGVAAREGWCRVVLDGQLDHLGDGRAGELRDQAQAEVDAGGDAAAGDPVAIDDHARGDGAGPEGRQEIDVSPVVVAS